MTIRGRTIEATILERGLFAVAAVLALMAMGAWATGSGRAGMAMAACAGCAAFFGLVGTAAQTFGEPVAPRPGRDRDE
jgi:hypothetical protein